MKTDSFVLEISQVSPGSSSGTPLLPKGVKNTPQNQPKNPSPKGNVKNKRVKNTGNQKVLLRKAAGSDHSQSERSPNRLERQQWLHTEMELWSANPLQGPAEPSLLLPFFWAVFN